MNNIQNSKTEAIIDITSYSLLNMDMIFYIVSGWETLITRLEPIKLQELHNGFV